MVNFMRFLVYAYFFELVFILNIIYSGQNPTILVNTNTAANTNNIIPSTPVAILVK